MPTSVSQSYQIEQAEMRMSVIRLDSALENSFSQMLLQGRSLSLNLKTIMLQTGAIPPGSAEHQMSLVRALSRLAGVFVSFAGPQTYLDANGATQQASATQKHLHKSFLNPTQYVTGVPVGAADESLLHWQVSIGPKSYPESSPSSNLAETFSLLRQALGIYDESIRTTSITDGNYRLNQFCIGVPLQIVDAPFSSVSTRSGDLLTVKLSNMDTGARQAGRIFVHMIAEVILELKEGGITVLD